MDFPVAFAHVLSRLENPMSDRITLLRPDDWHIHLRDGAALAHTVADAARQFARAIIMPNLVPPVRNAAEAHDYRQRIIDARPSGSRFEPLMVLYLTDGTSVEDVRAAKASGFVHAAKLYPAGATTNSASGVTKIDNIFHVLEAMAEVGLPLLVHGEVTRSEIDIFDREKHFIDEQLGRVTERFPTLKVVFEHITTRDAVQFVEAAGSNVGATITAHHLLYNRNHMLVGGIRPHFFCLPILKRNVHQEALLDAATSGSPKFFLGTDSAPTPSTPRKTPVAVPAATPPTRRSSSMPRPSSSATRWIVWKPSPATSAPTSTACRATPSRSPWCASPGACRAICPSASTMSCPCAPAKPCNGVWRQAHERGAVRRRIGEQPLG